MTNSDVTYLVGACSAVVGLAAFIALVVAPAFTSYRRPWERAAVLVLSGYVLAALIALGVVVGVIIVAEWPRLF
jgi:ABC-type Fe3+-siderophore transport system permease subunit